MAKSILKLILNRKTLYASLLLLVLAFGVGYKIAKADNGQALSISPPVLELNADPGQTVTASIKLTNISSGELLIKNQINDFGAKNETGEPNIIFEDNESSVYSLKNWVVAPAPFKIASKQTKLVDFQINVPKDAEPGGHYAVFRFTGQAPELEESGVALSASLGSLVLLKISGNVQEKASIADYFSANEQSTKTGFFESQPINFVERIRNDGNVHINPTGTIEILDIFNRKVDTLQVNGSPSDPKNPPRAILPASTRKFEQTLSKNWLFGPYRAKMHLTYGQQNQHSLDSVISFWVIPYKLIALAIVVLTLLVLLIRFTHKKYKQRIIKKYSTNTTGESTKQPHEPTASKKTTVNPRTPKK